MNRLYSVLMWTASFISLVGVLFASVVAGLGVSVFAHNASKAGIMPTTLRLSYALSWWALVVPVLMFVARYLITKRGVQEKFAPLHVAAGWVFASVWVLLPLLPLLFMFAHLHGG